MDNSQLEGLLRDVAARLDSIQNNNLSEKQVKEIAEGIVKNAQNDNADEYRKMRFGACDPALVGSKFARHNLTASDIEMLYDITSAAKNAGMGPGPSTELTNAFNAVSKATYMDENLVKAYDRTALDNLFPRVRKGIANKVELAAYAKAMDSLESGFGQQLMGAQYAADLWEAARPLSRVFSMVDTFEMTAPTAYLPVEVDIPEMLFVGESTSATAFTSPYATSKTGSNRVQVDAKKFVIHQVWSGELEEDSIIPFLPFLRRQAALAIAHYSDSLVLNGDTTNAATGNINLDDADPADTKHYLAFDGLRHIGLVDNTANSLALGAAVTYASLRAQLGRMRDSTRLIDWGHPIRPEDVVYITDPTTAEAIAQLTEVLTVDKYGPGATVLTGELMRVGRNPLISSMAMSLTEADGKVSTTAGNNTKGQVVCANMRGLKAGWRRRVKVETERLIGSDQSRIVYSLRMGLGRFSPTGAASGCEFADVLYNITV
jgi:HK97 family phage major capsid protein